MTGFRFAAVLAALTPGVPVTPAAGNVTAGHAEARRGPPNVVVVLPARLDEMVGCAGPSCR